MSDREQEQDEGPGERGFSGAAQSGSSSGDGNEIRRGELSHTRVRRHRTHKRVLSDSPLPQRVSCRRSNGQEVEISRGHAFLRQGIYRYGKHQDLYPMFKGK